MSSFHAFGLSGVVMVLSETDRRGEPEVASSPMPIQNIPDNPIKSRRFNAFIVLQLR